MPTSEQFVVIGVFDDAARADNAIDVLQHEGFSSDQVRRSAQQGERPAGLKGLFSGTSRENLMADLVSMGVDPEDAPRFQKEYEEGHPLVSVAGKGDMQKAINILVSQGAHGLEKEKGRKYGKREAERTEKRPDEVSSSGAEDVYRMQLRGERLRVYKQSIESGEVRIRKEVVTEEETLNVPVKHEELVIERHSQAENAAAVGEEPIGEGEEIRISLHEEQVQVSKETVPTGEVEISKREATENRQFSEKVRHEEPRIEKEGDAPIIDRSGNQNPDQPQI